MTQNSFAESLGPRLSAFGVGGIVSPDGSKDWVNESDFYKILDQATDRLGVSYIDSARTYELSEESIGQWLKTKSLTYKRELVVASKCSVKNFAGSDGVAAHIANEIDASLVAMNVDHLDLYWLHAPNRVVPFDVIIESFDRAIKAGKIGAYGVSNVSEPELKSILQISHANAWAPPAAVQNEYNLLVAHQQRGMLELCARNELLYFAYSPLAAGLLTGRYAEKSDLPDGSRWKLWSAARPFPSYWSDRTFAALESLKTLATGVRISPAALAPAWCLRQPSVSVTLLGPRRPEHLDVAKQAMGLKLKSAHISVPESFSSLT